MNGEGTLVGGLISILENCLKVKRESVKPISLTYKLYSQWVQQLGLDLIVKGFFFLNLNVFEPQPIR